MINWLRMERKVELRFQRIEALLRAGEERAKRRDARFARQHARDRQRLARRDASENKTADDVQVPRVRDLTKAQLKELRAVCPEFARDYEAFLRAFRDSPKGRKKS